MNDNLHIQLQQAEKRRVISAYMLDGRIHTFRFKRRLGTHPLLMEWAATHTAGRFFLGLGQLSFEKEEDAMMFILSPYHSDKFRGLTTDGN
jgi:hypothetical protein